MARLLIASPHRYPDLARLWHRFVARDLVPAFSRLGLQVETNIFCDANASQFKLHLFPGVRFSQAGADVRDFMEFYDFALNTECEFLFFLDADTFVLNGGWACSYVEAFNDSSVAAISFVPRRGVPAIFALLCRVASYRVLPRPVFACRYEFPEKWPDGVNLQPGDFAAKQLIERGKKIVNVSADASSRHVAYFRGTTGIRMSREQITRAAGQQAFEKCVARDSASAVAAYDNILLGALYQHLYGESFAPDPSGMPLGGSMTISDLRRVLSELHGREHLEMRRERFRRSEENILKMAAHEGIKLSIPHVLP